MVSARGLVASAATMLLAACSPSISPTAAVPSPEAAIAQAVKYCPDIQADLQGANLEAHLTKLIDPHHTYYRWDVMPWRDGAEECGPFKRSDGTWGHPSFGASVDPETGEVECGTECVTVADRG